ncbi:hypothetical protein [Amycolatopsis eburnea]|uniref:Helix-turn-helix domain-containing protein n=1 Tax=Amycolatopsis eburnea TaxID=2267691 RepID=A0A427TJD3_9PSEU|nr:hypothetical protein [Amycolatopsis eburnea]RSD23947.1 hypothetical protein EIY87_06140 [Amycolatopsis eburnea]
MKNDERTEIRAGRTEPAKFAKVPIWLVLNPDVTPQAKALYGALHAHVNVKRGDGAVWPALTTIAQMLGYRHRQSLTRYVKELDAVGAIDVEEVPGRSSIYVVHETPVDGYAGPQTLTDFYAARNAATEDALPDPVTVTDPRYRGRNPQVSTTRNSQVSTGRNSQVARIRRTESDEGNHTRTSSEGDSIEGTPVRAHASRSPQGRSQLKGPREDPALPGHLVGLTRKALTRQLTKIWTAVIRENGADWESSTPGGFDVDGAVRHRDRHPAGGRIKATIDQFDDFQLRETQVLAQLLTAVREDAVKWARQCHEGWQNAA